MFKLLKYTVNSRNLTFHGSPLNERRNRTLPRAGALLPSLILGLFINAVNAAPGDTLNDPFWSTGSNQVGNCGSSYNFGSCTANDFRITNLLLSNVVDGCSSATDYMQADLTVTFSKAQPIRYDVMAYVYRGEESGVPFDLDDEAAVSGDWCTRVGINNGLQIFNGGPTGSFTSDIDGDRTAPGSGIPACFDVPSGNQDGTLNQIEMGIVLPCRDGNSNGIVDIAACTGWSQNASSSNCSGPQYDGVTEPQNGTGSKCNCASFDTTPAVTIPDVSVAKVCVGNDAAGNGTNSPGADGTYANGDVVECTITISNAVGAGLLDGATTATTEGFFYIDDYDEVLGAIGPVTINNPGGGSPSSVDGSPSAGMLSIYPDDIAAGDDVVVTYLYTISATYTEAVPEPDIVNTVCLNYYDTSNGGTTTTYTDPVSGDCAVSTITTTPITLAGFSATRASIGGLNVEWVTATESNNLGFNIYGVRGESLVKLNSEIIPSQSVSTMDQSSYSLWLDINSGPALKQFYLEDIDIEGKTKKHGPFLLSNAGLDIVPQTVTDWKAIKAANKKAKQLKSNKGQQKNVAKQRLSELGIDANGRAASNRPTEARAADASLITNLVVSKSGLQRVAFSDLVGSGLSSDDLLRGRYLLTNKAGAEIPSRIQRIRKKQGGGGFLEFVGSAERSFYSSVSVYQIQKVSVNRSALSIPRASQKNNFDGQVSQYYHHTETLDDDLIYVNSSRVDDDPWMMKRLFAFGGTQSTSFELPINELNSEGGPALFSMDLAGGINIPEEIDRSASMSVAGTELARLQFDGNEAPTLQGDIELASGQDSVQVTLSSTPLNSYNVDILYANRVSVTYPRNYTAIENTLRFSSSDDYYEIDGFTDSSVRVLAVSGQDTIYLGRYAVSSGRFKFRGLPGHVEYLVYGKSAVVSPVVEVIEKTDLLASGAEHLIITHSDFVGSSLEDYRQHRTLISSGSSEIITTDSIYAQYGGGNRSAEAIQAFIKAYGLQNELASVLIIGGDVYDYHDNLGLGAVSFVPTLYRATDTLIRFSPVDSLYGDLDGDDVPDVPVGRIPARTMSELQTLLQKSIRYADLWGDRSAVLSADERGSNDAYDFRRSSERVAQLLEPQGWSMTKAYLDDLGIGLTRSTLVDGLNAGPRFVLYTGHSSPGNWSGKNMFGYQDALALTNVDRPSAYLQWGCYNTFFSSPTADSMSHGLMLAGDQGAAIVIGSSTLTSANAEERFSVLMQNELLKTDQTFGSAMIAAKRQYHSETGLTYKGIMWGVSLLGDPLLTL